MEDLDNPNIIAAAKWVAEPREYEGGRLIPALRERFRLSAAEACQACALASRFRDAGRAADA